MAKGEEPGSDKAELKRLLKISIDRPIHMAFALGADGKAVIKLDKMKQPRALEKGLKEDIEGGKNHRFGMVQVDPENPKKAKFIVNKEVSGIGRKLIIALKGTGFNKVQIVTEDGATLEEEEGEEEEEELEAGAGPTHGHGGDDDAPHAENGRDNGRPAPHLRGMDDDESTTSRAEPAQDPDGPGKQASPDKPAGNGPDADALTKDLTGLVRQMLAALKKDPSQKGALAELATDAQVSLKRGDLDQAAAGIEILRQAIADVADGSANGGPAPGGDTPGSQAKGNGNADGPPPGSNGQGSDPNGGDPKGADAGQLVKFRKSRIAWTATRAKVDAELQKLSKAILAASDGEDMGDSLEDEFFSAVDPVLSTLDETLSEILDDATNTTDAGERGELVSRARKTIDKYISFVQGNPIIADLDSNPFVPLQIEKTLTTTLTTLSTMMK